MLMLTEQQIVDICRYEVDQAQGYDSDVLASKREAALDYYHGKMQAAPAGRSSIVSKDVADTVHSLLSQVAPIFQTSLIQFIPDSENDEQQAQLESDYVRYEFERSDGYKLLNEAAHDALLIGNGWLKCEIEEETTVRTDKYGELDEYQVMALVRPQQQGETVDINPTKGGYSVRREVTTYRLAVSCIAPELILYSNTEGQDNPDDLRMIGERSLYTSAQLSEMGVSDEDIDSIPFADNSDWPGSRAREGIYQDDDSEAAQDAERLRECFDVYIRLDLNESNTVELRRVLFGGDVMISNEPVYCSPYATGSPIPLPHRIQGTGMFEIVGAIQESKTNVLRSYVDNLKVMNQSRLGVVEGEVNMKDAVSARLNGIIRMKTPNSIMPIPSTDIGDKAIMGLNYLDTVRSQRGGASVDMNSADRQLMQSSATAASGAMETAERMAGWYSHNLVNTLLKSTFKLIHKKLRNEMPGAREVNLRGKWVETDPADWQEREHIEITAGMTTTERAAKIQGLTATIAYLEKAILSGGDGIITDQGKLYGALSDWVRAADVGTPEEYLIDPDSEEAQQVAKQNAEQQQQQQQMIEQQQQQIMDMQKQIEDQKVQFDYYKVDQETKFKYYDANLDAETEEAKLTTDTIVKLNSGSNEESKKATG